MSFIGNIFQGIGDFFTGGSDEEKKKKQQSQTKVAAPRPVAPSFQNSPIQMPNIVTPTKPYLDPNPAADTLQKVNGNTPSPAQQRAAASLAAMGGPVDRNYQSHQINAGDVGLEAVKGIGHTFIDPGVTSFQNMQKANAEVLARKSRENTGERGLGRGMAVAGAAMPEQIGNFVNAIGETGLEYAAYVAPEIKALKVAASAPKLVKAATGLVRQGATSAPLSVASDIVHGEYDPLTIAQHATVATLGAGGIGALTSLRKVAPGITSVNPAQIEDAAAVQAAQEAKAAAAAPAPPPPIKPDAMNPQETEALTAMDKIAKERVLNPEEQAMRAELQDKKALIDEMNNPKPVDLDKPTYKRQGKPEPEPKSSLDIPTYQRNAADELVKQAQARVDELNNLQKVEPNNQATRQAKQQELAKAMATDPKQAATILRKQLLEKATGQSDPAVVEAALAPLRAKAETELANAKVVQQAKEALTPKSAAPTKTPASVPASATPPKSESAPLKKAAPAPAAAKPPVATQAAPPPTEPVASNTPLKSSTGEEVPVAPRTHDAATKRMNKDLKDVIEGQYGTREKVNIEELHTNADATIGKMSHEKLTERYESGAHFDSPQAIVDGIHALDALSKAPESPGVVSAVDNLATALAESQSKAGVTLRVGQIIWDQMPTSLKKATLLKRLARNGVEVSDEQGNELGRLLKESDALKATRETAANELSKLNELSPEELATRETSTRVKQATKAFDEAKREGEYADGATSDYFVHLLPKNAFGERLAQNARVMMLSAPTGRIHDFASTASNSIVESAVDTVQAGLNKVVNKVRGNNKLPDELPSPRKHAQGFVTGVKDTARAMVHGEHRKTNFKGDIKKTVNRSNVDPTGSVKWNNPLKKVGNIVKNVVIGATESPTLVTQGHADAKLYQLAQQAGKQAGLKGKALDNYAEVNSRLRSSLENYLANEDHLKVNNLHHNGVAQAMSGAVQAIQRATKGSKMGETIVPQVINQIAPFTSWMSGNIHRTLTDANMLHNTTQLIQAIHRKDAEAATKQAARLSVNGGLFGAGYLMAQGGEITDHDANGDKYAGNYFHFGNLYIPLALLGPYAAPLIFGAAAHGISQKDGGWSKPGNIGSGISDAAGNAIKSLSVTTTLGGSNAFQAGIANIGSDRQSAAEVAVDIAAGAAGQYVPSVTRDVNAAIDTYDDKANPTHEAADTKAYATNDKGNEVVDPMKTALNKFQVTIPGKAQELPRKEGTPARTLTDRSLQGTHDTNATVAVRQADKAQVDQTKANKANDIPDPNADYPKGTSFESAVQARIERGEYDKASQGLQQKLDSIKGNKDIAASTVSDLEDRIKQVKILQSGHYDPSIVELYKSTELAEWRNMGDPENEAFDQATYDLLFEYDSKLAAAGISKSKRSKDDNAYSAKAPGKGRGGSGGSGSTAGGDPGSPLSLGKINFGSLALQKASAPNMPTIQKIPANQLVKKRIISVKKGR